MAASGTYTFNPSGGELALAALGMCGVPRTSVTPQHLADASLQSNLLLVDLANRQPNLWTSYLYSVTMVASTATYVLPSRAQAIQRDGAYISTTSGSTTTDRIISPISTAHYTSIPNKALTGVPNVYWFQRLITPQVTVWPVPDTATTYTLNLRLLSQIQDTDMKNGINVGLPYRWLDAYTSALASRLAITYAPDKAEALFKLAKVAYDAAAEEDVEDVPLSITPALGGYYR